MPELPEVETIVRGLNQAIIGRKIKSIDILVDKLFIGNKNSVMKSKIIEVKRLGKTILIYFENNYLLHIHLKMTGQLIFVNKNQQFKIKNLKLKIPPTIKIVGGGHPDKKYDQPLPHKYTHIIIKFTDESTLFYNDLRKFGWMKILDSRIKNLESRFGIDALSEKLNSNYLSSKLSKRNITTKQALLDQSIISGIGNIYSDEILFCARILPDKKVGKLKPSEINNIVNFIPIVLNKSIDLGGTSRSDYLKIDGSRGNYLKYAYVYGRENEKCRVCNTKIKRIKIGQRSSHFCTNCQK